MLIILILEHAYRDVQKSRPGHRSRHRHRQERVVTADDVAESMMSLIQSNRFVTGEVIVIDGGFTSST